MLKDEYKVYEEKMKKSIDSVAADFASVRAGQAVFPHCPADSPAAGRYAAAGERGLYPARAVPPAARPVRGQHVGLDGVRRLRGFRARAHGIVGRARNAEYLALRRYRVAAGVRRHRRHFRANIGAACSKTSTSMRSRLFSRSSPMIRFCPGVRLSAARGETDAFIALTHLIYCLCHFSRSGRALLL